MPVVEVDSLQKTFVRGFLRRKTEALRGISLSVERGEIFGFLGPNGAGKTTTIKILMGLIFPSGGKASIFGVPAGDREAKRRLGYLPENPYFYDYLSVTELLDMVGRLYGLDRADRRRRAGRLIERVGLSHAATRPLRSYSKGMVQRAGLAQALMGDPELIVLDEPMSGLDPIGRKEVRDLVLELREQGKTVFFSTHILSDATLMCDRVGIIVRGKLHAVGPLGELLSPGIKSVQIVWDAPDASAVKDAMAQVAGDHTETSEGHVFMARDMEGAQTFITRVVHSGGRVLQVAPHREGLEELFVTEATQGEGRVRHAG